jgi:Tol biopolymer transport system component
LTRISLSSDGIAAPRISPDGRELAFHVIDAAGIMNVWTQPLDGGARRQITFDKEAMSYPAWSTDGKWLAVEIKRGDQVQIGVVPSNGGPVDQLTFDRGQSWPDSWAPDNDRIAFAAQRDGVWNIWDVSRKTRKAEQLTHFTSVSGFVRYPAWSPRGDRIVFERDEEIGSVWAVKLP